MNADELSQLFQSLADIFDGFDNRPVSMDAVTTQFIRRNQLNVVFDEGAVTEIALTSL